MNFLADIPILLAQGDAPAAGAEFMLIVAALPLLASALCALCAAFGVKSKLPAWISVALLAASFAGTVLTLVQVGGQVRIAYGFEWIRFTLGDGTRFVADWAFYVDSLSLLWMLFITGLGTLIALYASEYMEHDKGVGYSRFFFAFNLFVFVMSVLVLADNLVLLYLGWEGVGLCSYLLIGYFYKKPSAVAAAKKAFIVNRIGDLGLALGVMLTFVQFGTVRYTELFTAIGPYVELAREGRFAEIPVLIQLIPVLLMVGAFGKSAQLPLYVWLPDAMEGPTPVSALIHAATMVTAGVFLIARMYLLFVCSAWALPTVAWIGALTALLAATIGMAQFDIKRIMAYSTISQLGYMFAGLGVLTSVGAAFHVFTHAFFKASLFLCCGAVMHGFAGQLDLRKVSGLWKMRGWKIVVITMLVASLNLSGIPGTAGFFSKDLIIAGAFVTPVYGSPIIGWILLLTAGLTAYYTFRVFFRVFVGPVQFEPGEEWHGDESESTDIQTGEADQGDHGSASRATGSRATGSQGGFHPHAPRWAINTTLAILAVATTLVAGVYFIDRDQEGWVGSMVHASSANYESPYAHPEADSGAGESSGLTPAGEEAAIAGFEPGTFLGQNPHAVMFYASALFGLIGIGAAWWLHYAGRTGAATSRADDLAMTRTRVADWARHKWYVDEFYDFLIRKPLWVLGFVFYWIDQLLVDGLVNLFGWLPRFVGSIVRPTQSGVLHGYAAGMAGGVGVILLVIWLATM